LTGTGAPAGLSGYALKWMRVTVGGGFRYFPYLD
jgi:hypothetical protein